MEPLATIEIIGAWISIFLTLCILSFLYEDNPIYKLAEHLFLGVSIGIAITEIWWGTLWPNLVQPLWNAANALVGSGELRPSDVFKIVPFAMAVMLFMKLNRGKYSWLARIPIAFIVAAYAGVKLTGEANGNLMTQVAQSMPNLADDWAKYGFWDWSADGAGVFSSIVLVVGLSACLLHFYFSAPHNKAMQWVSRFGVLMLMLSFGASFGYTVMGRISLAIGRAQEMLGLDKAPEAVEQIHPRVASLVCLVAVVLFLAIWQKRRGDGEPPEPAAT
jgi:hypothetical protein